MKITNVKAAVAKVMAVVFLAGAFVVGAPVKAEAQQFAVGVQFGSPYYGDHDRHEYYERLRNDEYLRQQAFLRQQAYDRHEAWERHERHEAWEHQGYGYQSYGYYDHRDWDGRR